MTTQKGEALLTFSDGRAPVTKLKEVNQAVTELIGLDMKQFTQIEIGRASCRERVYLCV